MTKIQTTVKNSTKGSYALYIDRGISKKLQKGEIVKFDFDIWSKIDRVTKQRLDRDIRKGIIEITTTMITEGGKAVTETAGNINISDAPKEEAKPKSAPVKPAANNAAVKAGVTQVASGIVTTEPNKDIADKLGAKVSNVADRETNSSVKNLQDTHGFTATDDMGKAKLNQVFAPKEKPQVEKVKTTGLWNNGEAATEGLAKEATETPVEEPVEETNDVAARIDELYSMEDYTGIYELCKETWPDSKVKKVAIKDCKSWKELAAKCNLTLPS